MAPGRQGFLKRAGFLLAALLLLLAAGLLLDEPSAPRARRAGVEFPRYPRPHEVERQERRSTWIAKQPEPPQPIEPSRSAEPSPAHEPAPVDPLHLALADQDAALVLEAGALRDSPLGRMLLACLSPAQLEVLDGLERRLGFRPLEQIERLAVGAPGQGEQPLLMLQGDFRAFDPRGLELDVPFESHGPRGQLAVRDAAAIAAWDGQLLMVGAADAVRGALALLDGERPARFTALSGEAYGDIYGTLSGLAVSRLVPSELRERVLTTTERVTLHVDATEDVLLVAGVYGANGEALRDLATAVGGALAVGRLQAARSNDLVLNDLLEQSRVIPDDGSFQLEMALPLATIREQLGECARDVANDDPL